MKFQVKQNLTLIYFLFLSLYNFTKSQDTAANIIKSAQPIDSFLKSTGSLFDKKVYFYGEAHHVINTDVLAFNLFSVISNNYKGKKVFIVEGGKALEYAVYKYRRDISFFYGKNAVIPLSRFKLAEKFFEGISKFKNDTNIVIKTFDMGEANNSSLLSLFDLLNCSNNKSVFDEEINYYKSGNFLAENIQTDQACKYFVSRFNRDSLKYTKYLEPNLYYFYSEIIHELESEFIYDSLGYVDYYRSVDYRENYLFNQLKSIISKSEANIFFIRCGLAHVIDTIHSYSKFIGYPFLSAAGRFKKHFAETKVAKIGLVLLKKESEYSSYFISKNTQKLLNDVFGKKMYYIPNADFIRNKDFDYLIFCRVNSDFP